MRNAFAHAAAAVAQRGAGVPIRLAHDVHGAASEGLTLGSWLVRPCQKAVFFFKDLGHKGCDESLLASTPARYAAKR